MSEDIRRYRESFKIRASEVDEQGLSTLSAIAALFQEVAGNHALRLNFDITDLHKQNLTWVLHRLDIQMSRYPEWREHITIETWPAAGDRLRAYRDYRILDEENNIIGVALSYWMMMNLETRRPVRMPEEVLELRLQNTDHVLEIKNDRIRPFDDGNISHSISVRRSDLDMNNHVNNTLYLEWMADALPDSRRRQVLNTDIIFLRECTFGEELNSEWKPEETEENDSVHQLRNKEGQVIALARFS